MNFLRKLFKRGDSDEAEAEETPIHLDQEVRKRQLLRLEKALDQLTNEMRNCESLDNPGWRVRVNEYTRLAGDASAVAGPPLGVLVVPARTRFRRSGPPREAEFGRADAPVWVPMALAAAEAWQQAAAARASDNAKAERLIAHVVAAVQSIPDLDIPALAGERLPHVLTFSALYVDGEAIVTELDRRGLAVASGSACTSSTLEPSHVLAAMGALTHGNVRLRLPWAAAVPDRADAVRRLCAELPDVVRELRERLGVSGL